MFTKKVINIASVVAIVLSALAILISCFGVYSSQSTVSFRFVIGCISWILLLWSSVVGYQITRIYNLYEDEYKKVGYRIYAIIAAFILFLTIGLIGGIFISVYILSTIRGLKKNYDEWNDKHEIESIGEDLNELEGNNKSEN